MTEFNKYLKEARQEFCKEVNKYTVSDNLQLRTACDSFLIAFDQATEQAINYTHSCKTFKEMRQKLIDTLEQKRNTLIFIDKELNAIDLNNELQYNEMLKERNCVKAQLDLLEHLLS